MAGDAGAEIPWQVLDQADASALGREVEIARRCRADGVRIGVEIEHIRNEGRRCSAQLDMLNACGDLRLGRFAELHLVEDIAGDLGVLVRVPQAVDRAADVVGAGRGQLLMRDLRAESGGQRCKAQVERCELHLNAAFLLLVGEGLAHAIAREVIRIGKTDFVVLVIGRAGPEANHVDRSRIRMVIAL